MCSLSFINRITKDGDRIDNGGFATKPHKHQESVVPAPLLSDPCETWLCSIDMKEICPSACLLTGHADRLAACLFVHSLPRSEQTPPLFLRAFALVLRAWGLEVIQAPLRWQFQFIGIKTLQALVKILCVNVLCFDLIWKPIRTSIPVVQVFQM